MKSILGSFAGPVFLVLMALVSFAYYRLVEALFGDSSLFGPLMLTPMVIVSLRFPSLLLYNFAILPPIRIRQVLSRLESPDDPGLWR
jgi:hypothetical protein